MKRAARSLSSEELAADVQWVEGDRLARLSPELLASRPVAVIGAGPAGVAVAQGLVGADEGLSVVLIGEEADAPYNRVQLTPFLAGDAGESELRIGPELDEVDHRLFARLAGCRIASIDPERMVVTDEHGGELCCSHIVLATGSRPLVPPIPGVNLPGVYSFRTLADARTLGTLAAGVNRAVVIGGGLLGLEAGRGLVRHECPVSVVERAERLMPLQLNDEASHRLQGTLEACGVDVRLGATVERIDGPRQVRSVTLDCGESIDCELVVVAAGVRPNTELASAAGLVTDRGIVVDRSMQTSAPNILAVGECAELDGCVQGLAGPALAQARVAAATICEQDRPLEPGVAAARLKIFDHPVFSLGSPDTPGRLVEWSDGDAYRCLTLRRHRVVAAVGIGDWPQLHEVQRAVTDRRFLWPWQIGSFRSGGAWTRDTRNAEPDSWAPDRIICNCTQTTCAQLHTARASGCRTVEDLQNRTGASRVCGSCHDLIASFADTPAANAPVISGHRRWQMLAGIGVGLVMAIALLPSVSMPASVDSVWFDVSILWRAGGWRQVTGYGLLICLVLMMGFSARKRLKRFRLSSAPFWRWFHAVAGVSLLALVAVHTALSWGGGLSTWLLVLLLGASLMGVTAGAIGPDANPAVKRTLFWGHLLLVWPLPVLLGFHILSVYWF